MASVDAVETNHMIPDEKKNIPGLSCTTSASETIRKNNEN